MRTCAIGLAANAAQYTVNPALYPKLSYDPLRDFDPVSKAIVAKLNAEAARALAQPDPRTAFEKEAIELVGGSPEAFGEYLKSELGKWGALVRSSGLRSTDYRTQNKQTAHRTFSIAGRFRPEPECHDRSTGAGSPAMHRSACLTGTTGT